MSFAGGKQPVFKRIVNLMPPHDLYVESHLGGGAILRGKRPSAQNIGIDRDSLVIGRYTGFPENFRFICGDAIEVLEAISPHAKALIYCDPPYLASARRSQRSPYKYDLSETDHRRLLGYLRQLPCAVMISGYPSQLYSHVLADWNCVQFSSPSRVGGRLEMLWMNFPSPDLLHDTRFLGDTFREREVFSRRRRRWHAQFSRMTLTEQQAILSDLAEAFTDGLTSEQRELWDRSRRHARTGTENLTPFCLDQSARFENLPNLPPCYA